MPRRPSSRSGARSYTFSRNPAPRVLETSKTAPSTRSVSESKYPGSSVFIRGQYSSCRPNLIPLGTIYWPPMNADNTKCLNAYPRSSAFIGGHIFFGLARYAGLSVDRTVPFSGSSDCGGGAADATACGSAGAGRCGARVAGPARAGACGDVSARTADLSRLYAGGVSADFRPRGGALHLAAAG